VLSLATSSSSLFLLHYWRLERSWEPALDPLDLGQKDLQDVLILLRTFGRLDAGFARRAGFLGLPGGNNYK
jgi:hypothetical protein